MSKPDAIELLKEDHRQLRKLFSEFKTASKDDTRLMVIATTCEALMVHVQIEEEIFYPAVRQGLEVDALLDEAEVEHRVAHKLMEDIGELEWGGHKLYAIFTVLAEYTEHHLKEEENELFPKVSAAKNLDLKQLGRQLAERKQELLIEMEEEAEQEEDEEQAAAHQSRHARASKSRPHPTRH